MQFPGRTADRAAGRFAGRFDLDEADFAKLEQGDLAVLVVIAKRGALSLEPNERTGETALLQIFKPLDVHVAINGLREQLLTAINDDDQLKLAFPSEPSEEDFDPPDDVESFPARPTLDDQRTSERVADLVEQAEAGTLEYDTAALRERVETREPEREPATGLKRMLPTAEELDDMDQGTRVVGHIDDRTGKGGADSESPTARGRRALLNFMEATHGR